jgi:hypothetical protein
MHMSRTEKFGLWLLACSFMLAIATSSYCETRPGHDGLIVVPANKLPPQARQPGQSMTLYLIEPGLLYLYVEQDNGNQLAVFDVSNPHKIKFKKMVALNAPAPFDFVQSIGSRTDMIRYRDGRGTALIDLSKPKSPRLVAVNDPAAEAYVLPMHTRADTTPGRAVEFQEQPLQDYQILTPASSQPVAVIKGVQQEQIDDATGTIYLLGGDGLTVVRNPGCERKLAEMTPPWTNTIDDE